jgi:phosphoribosylformylglycinamidine cyclo-ligase
MTDVSIVIGSSSDLVIAKRAETTLDSLNVSHETKVLSAHRDPKELDAYIASNPAKVFIAIAGLAAHLPGYIASRTTRPVIGVPVNKALGGLDSLLSIVQMPRGVPVCAVGIDSAENAAHLAKRILDVSRWAWTTSRLTYAKAGVDVAKVSGIHKDIDRILSKTYQTRKGKAGKVLGVRQHYAGLIEISEDYALALHADGVGTKVLVAEVLRKYDTVGIDCVAMNVNDVICLGAEPLALVNYLVLDRARPEVVRNVMIGLRRGALEAGVAVVSGETAIMPDIVRGFDLAATIVGLVRKDRIITGDATKIGDVILGLRSSGIHSNGLTLARRILLKGRSNPAIARELLRPTRIYVKQISALLKANIEIHGLAHITGGAYSKLKRIGKRAKVCFVLDTLPKPQPIFKEIQHKGHVSDREMYRTFNMGTGFLVICPMKMVKRVQSLLPEIKQVGRVTRGHSVTVTVSGREVDVESYWELLEQLRMDTFYEWNLI